MKEYSVELLFKEDEAYGLWGLVPEPMQYTFNSFWNIQGLFHDVFEHWFEQILPIFSGNNSNTIYGECAAEGMKAFFYGDLGVNMFREGYTGPVIFTEDVIPHINNYLIEDEAEYEMKSIHLPTIKPMRSYSVSNALSEIEYILNGYGMKKANRKGLKMSCFRNAYWYGYRLADKLFGRYDPKEVYVKLTDFIEDWYKILNTNCRDEVVRNGNCWVMHDSGEYEAELLRSLTFNIKFKKSTFDIDCIVKAGLITDSINRVDIITL